ncbi:glutaredoxin [Croceicoccus ponticola]|uniref:Methylamine utilization protein MauE n=2 Tax=Croceicoccus ponticola TaxID=2217664 RepID=A0A437GXV7_9SPHN|nr:glutaredoxin [Croceicoccus ponticola]
MVMPGHVCPYGLKTVDLLKRKGFAIDDRHLTTRDETNAFKAEYDVKTTPQTFIGPNRIGGYDDLRAHFGKSVRKAGDTTYQPVIALFAMAAFVALAFSWFAYGALLTVAAGEWFVSLAMCFLAVQKLQDVRSFSTMFLNYDLLARRWLPYGYVYPFGEALAGVLMVAHVLPIISVPISLFIGTLGAVSVFKAVYIDKREIKCACVGGNSNVPLGFVSLTENLFMIGMGLWMGAKAMGWIVA